jgi:mono/diheme cytochrome c family protein
MTTPCRSENATARWREAGAARWWTALAVLLVPLAASGGEKGFATGLTPWLRQNCITCHNAKKASGGVDFSSFKDQSAAKARFDLWKKAVEQVRLGNMPPDDPLGTDAKQPLLAWYEATFDTSRNPDPGPPLIRPLTRNEYSQTMRDLLRLNFDAAGEAGIPEENVVDGFPNRAGSLVLDSSLMEKYFTAADLALERLFTDAGAKRARTALLAAMPSAKISPAEASRQTLKVFLRRAFRRPVTDKEVDRYAAIADRSIKAGDSYETAIRKAMKPILVSPHFLLRIETPPEKPATVRRVSDHELAVRLSYFLWGTMPDDELLASADKGKLGQPEVLEQQVRRLLKHDRANSLTTNFLTYWLQLRHLRKALPSLNQFPTFTRSLRDAMERETWLFCDHLRKEDRSVLELLDSNYTFANAELARHYRLKDTPAQGFEKVSLRAEDHRGGVLGMASMLTMTSHTDRTKPTARGKWVLDVLLGSPPPPPPANAGNFAPPPKDRPEPANFREKLAQHASDRNCVSCHRRIDPLGFALENFDAIGNWRDSIGTTPVDNTGKLPGLAEFKGVDGLRTVLRSKQSQFVGNLTAQTLTYALGRDLNYYDESSLQAITATLDRDGYRFSTLIVEVVKSYPFQHRKAE